jgi:hypothetical protein
MQRNLTGVATQQGYECSGSVTIEEMAIEVICSPFIIIIILFCIALFVTTRKK